MKYLKLFENKEEELRELIPELDDLCQDLKDHGFQINFGSRYKGKIIFPKNKPIMIDITDLDDYRSDKYIDILRLLISRNDKSFYIDDFLINNLLFIESYSEGELGIKVNSYDYGETVELGYSMYLFKNIKDLPIDNEVGHIGIEFYKA